MTQPQVVPTGPPAGPTGPVPGSVRKVVRAQRRRRRIGFWLGLLLLIAATVLWAMLSPRSLEVIDEFGFRDEVIFNDMARAEPFPPPIPEPVFIDEAPPPLLDPDDG